ncbi:MAG: glycosyltransferase family 4 protein [Gammaproteobacteria bacterium]|nr:glycosyltransferase family 4 protein [Gammaproteobacteria bacterium]
MEKKVKFLICEPQHIEQAFFQECNLWIADKPMNKLIFLNRYYYPDQSATSQLLTDLTFHLAREGARVMVIAGRHSYSKKLPRLLPAEDIENVQVKRVWTSGFGRDWLPGRVVDYLSYYFSSLLTLLIYAKKGDIIVAETDPPLISVVAWLVAKLKGSHTVNWVQDLFPEIADVLKVKGFNGVFSRFLKSVRNVSFRDAIMNVVLGERMAERLYELGVRYSSVEIVHNWSPVTAIRPITKEKNRLRNEWDLKGKFIVGYSGNMGRVHDFSTVLGTAEIMRNHKEIVFLFIGSGPQKTWMEEETKRKKLHNVLFLPPQERAMLPYSLTLPDLHLITLKSDVEGLSVPSKFYGAGAASKPVIFIGDEQGELAKLIRECEGGAVIREHDSEALAQTVLRLKESPVECERMGDNIRRLVLSKFDKSIAVDHWKDLIINLTNRHKVDLGIISQSSDKDKNTIDNSKICWISDKSASNRP